MASSSSSSRTGVPEPPTELTPALMSALTKGVHRRVQFLRSKGVKIQSMDMDYIGPIDDHVYLCLLRQPISGRIANWKVTGPMRRGLFFVSGEVSSRLEPNPSTTTIAGSTVKYQKICSGPEIYLCQYETNKTRGQVRICVSGVPVIYHHKEIWERLQKASLKNKDSGDHVTLDEILHWMRELSDPTMTRQNNEHVLEFIAQATDEDWERMTTDAFERNQTPRRCAAPGCLCTASSTQTSRR